MNRKNYELISKIPSKKYYKFVLVFYKYTGILDDLIKMNE